MVVQSPRVHRLDLVRVTEAAALSAARGMGLGQVKKADEAACFMRSIQLLTDTYNANDNFAGSKMTTGDLKRAMNDTNRSSKSVDPNRIRTRSGDGR